MQKGAFELATQMPPSRPRHPGFTRHVNEEFPPYVTRDNNGAIRAQLPGRMRKAAKKWGIHGISFSQQPWSSADAAHAWALAQIARLEREIAAAGGSL